MIKNLFAGIVTAALCSASATSQTVHNFGDGCYPDPGQPRPTMNVVDQTPTIGEAVDMFITGMPTYYSHYVAPGVVLFNTYWDSTVIPTPCRRVWVGLDGMSVGGLPLTVHNGYVDLPIFVIPNDPVLLDHRWFFQIYFAHEGLIGSTNGLGLYFGS